MAERPIRLFVDTPLEAGAQIALDAPRTHYLLRVMRCRGGDRLRLFDGATGEWAGELHVERRGASVTVAERCRVQVPEPGPVLAMAPIRRPRLEWAVEKATELGISGFQPVLTARGGDDRVNCARLRAIAVEAAEQCERLTVPTIAPARALGDWLGTRQGRVPLYVGMERSDAVDLGAAVGAHGPGDLLIGPEGGFAADDRAVLATAKSCVPVSLGPRILRAETAAIAGLAVLALIRPRVPDPGGPDGGR